MTTMNKESYIAEVRGKLSRLPQSDIDHWLDYYSEMIDDRLEDGMTEDEAIGAIGTADEVAEQILLETPLPKLIKAKVNPSRSYRAWEIVLLVLGSPLWVSLLIAAAAVIFAVYISLWAVVVSLYTADFAIAVSGIAALGLCAYLIASGNVLIGLVALGAALILMGLSVLLFFLAALAAKGVIQLGVLSVRGLKKLFIK